MLLNCGSLRYVADKEDTSTHCQICGEVHLLRITVLFDPTPFC